MVGGPTMVHASHAVPAASERVYIYIYICTYIYILGLYRNNGEENENYYNVCYYRFGRLEKKMVMETTVMGYIGLGRMEKKMETTM